MKLIKRWFKNNRQVFKFIFLIFITWQLIIAAIIAFGQRYFPTTGQYLYTERKVINSPWLWSRANFDGMHYLDVARKGYAIQQQAFFPLYSKLIRLLSSYLDGRDLIAGVAISWLSLFLALFFFYKLIRLDWKEKIARRAIFYLLVFPTAFFFSMVYTESLFLFLVLASFYFARTRKWWLAGIFGAFASATRLPGIFLFPALLIEWWQQRKFGNWSASWRMEIGNFLFLLLIPLGLLYYMRFLQVNFQNPLLFVHAQSHSGLGRSTGKIILLYQVFWRYLKMLITVDKMTTTYFVCVLECLAGVAFLVLTIFTYLRRWFSYSTFMVLVYITPTLTGTFLSMPRFVLALFPGFILLALWAEKYRWIRLVYPLLAVSLLVVSLLFFSCGYFVA